MNLSDEDLNDIAQAMGEAVRRINIFSTTASRWIDLRTRAYDELLHRRTVNTKPGKE